MIAGVTFHPRETWQDPEYPVAGPPADWGVICRPIAHYTADDDLIDGDPGESADDLPGYLRAMQRHYVTARGYSVGYQFAIDWLGGVWELRGFDFQSAANKGDERKTGVRNVNPVTAPILFLVDGADRATDEAVNAARFVLAEMARRAARPLDPLVSHSALDFTACCGAGIRAQIAAGVFSQPPIVPPEPLPPLPPIVEEVDLMLYILRPSNSGDVENGVAEKAISANPNDPHLAMFASGNVRRAVNADYDYAAENGIATYVLESVDQYDYLKRLAGV
jgi:hypothetical protein